MSPIERIMTAGPVIAVLTLDEAGRAAEVARALVAGGVRVLEVTLRTPAALDAIAAMARVEGAIVGAGTVVSADQVDAAARAGAQFLVSPGLTERVARAALASGLPFLPGIATAGDIMRGMELGLDRFKFFPAIAAGGLPALKSLAAPFGDARFCPTGGITPDNAGAWLAEPSVLCVGGSWLVKPDMDASAIEAAARQAAALGG